MSFDFPLPTVLLTNKTSPQTETQSTLKISKKENPNSSNTRTMAGYLTEVPCSVWLLLAVIMSNTNQDQAVHKMVVRHPCGLELYSSREALPGK